MLSCAPHWFKKTLCTKGFEQLKKRQRPTREQGLACQAFTTIRPPIHFSASEDGSIAPMRQNPIQFSQRSVIYGPIVESCNFSRSGRWFCSLRAGCKFRGRRLLGAVQGHERI